MALSRLHAPRCPRGFARVIVRGWVEGSGFMFPNELLAPVPAVAACAATTGDSSGPAVASEPGHVSAAAGCGRARAAHWPLWRRQPELWPAPGGVTPPVAKRRAAEVPPWPETGTQAVVPLTEPHIDRRGATASEEQLALDRRRAEEAKAEAEWARQRSYAAMMRQRAEEGNVKRQKGLASAAQKLASDEKKARAAAETEKEKEAGLRARAVEAQ